MPVPESALFTQLALLSLPGTGIHSWRFFSSPCFKKPLFRELKPEEGKPLGPLPQNMDIVSYESCKCHWYRSWQEEGRLGEGMGYVLQFCVLLCSPFSGKLIDSL